MSGWAIAITVLDAIETRAEELSGVTVHQMLPLRERCYMHGDFEGLRGGSRRGDGNECDRPAFVVSFVLDAEGRVLDGTPLHAAIERIDAKAPPLFYSISCVHPSVAARALRDERVFSDLVVRRLVEFIVQLDHLEGHDAEHFAAGMWEIHEDFGLRILGGCCGTDDRHIRTLAALMADANKT